MKLQILPVLIGLLGANAIPIAAAAATEHRFAECRTIMDGAPVRVDLFEEIDGDRNPSGRGRAKVSSQMLDRFISEAPEDLGPLPDVTSNRLEVHHDAAARRVRMYIALDPNELFLNFDLPREPKLVEVDMNTPSGLRWGRFECINLPKPDCGHVMTRPR